MSKTIVCFNVLYHSIEWLLICGGEMEMELVDGGEKLQGLCFEVCVCFVCGCGQH